MRVLQNHICNNNTLNEMNKINSAIDNENDKNKTNPGK